MALEAAEAAHGARGVPPRNGLCNSRALGAELAVAHALTIGGNVVRGLGGFLAVVGMRTQGGQHSVQGPGIENLAARIGPRLGAVRAGGEERLGDCPQFFREVKRVHDPNRVGEHLRHRAPTPFLIAQQFQPEL